MAALLPRTCMTLLPYETSDVYLASYLLCQGATLVETERVGPRRTMFRFQSDEFLHALLRVYWSNDDVLLPPTRLFGSLRALKSRIRKRSPAAPAAGSFHAANAPDESTIHPAGSHTPPSPHHHAQ
jgi:hypothetical protein